MPKRKIQKPKKRIRLSLKEKISIIERSATQSIDQLVKSSGASLTTIYDILQRKNELTNMWLETQNANIKNKVRKAPNDSINTEVYNWFIAARSKGIPVSGCILQETAKEIASKLNVTGFKASNGWLESFKTRHLLTFNALCGELNDVNQSIVDDWKQKLPEIIAGYEMKETALFFRAIPSKSLQLKGEKCSGGKLSKERLSVLLCAFWDGTFVKPLVIGKAAKPRCFKNLDIKKFPVDWESNKKAWMTGTHTRFLG